MLQINDCNPLSYMIHEEAVYLTITDIPDWFCDGNIIEFLLVCNFSSNISISCLQLLVTICCPNWWHGTLPNIPYVEFPITPQSFLPLLTISTTPQLSVEIMAWELNPGPSITSRMLLRNEPLDPQQKVEASLLITAML